MSVPEGLKMFRKNTEEVGVHGLSGKDAKELRRSILKQYPTITEEELAGG